MAQAFHVGGTKGDRTTCEIVDAPVLEGDDVPLCVVNMRLAKEHAPHLLLDAADDGYVFETVRP